MFYSPRPATVALFLLAAALRSSSFAQTAYSYKTIVVPGAGLTMAFGINDKDQVVGAYNATEASNSHGFLLSDGTFTEIYFPGGSGTVPFAINRSGTIAGYYFAPEGFYHGFVLKDGVYTDVLYPGAQVTYLLGINDYGQAAGYALSALGDLNNFLYREGAFTSVSIPFPTPFLYGVNDLGQLTGCSECSGDNPVGFFYNGKTFLKIDDPLGGATLTYAANVKGQIVGFYVAHTATCDFDCGFVYSTSSKTYTNILPPGAVSAEPSAINNHGVIAGYSFGAAGYQGFVAIPAIGATDEKP